MKVTKIKENTDINKVLEGIGHDLREAFADASPKDSGFLMRNIDYVVKEGGIIRFTFPDYAKFLEYGTGLYGELGPKEVIRPKTKKVLKFKINGEDIFVKYVKGMTPRPFIRPTLHQKLKGIVTKNFK